MSHRALPRGSVPFALFVIASLAALIVFAPARRSGTANAGLSLDAPLPDRVPPGVVLRVGDPADRWIFQHLGWEKELPFKVQWAEITGGPGVTEAFHAGALDVGLGVSVPPIHARWAGIPVRIVAFRQMAPGHAPLYTFGIAPGAGIRSIADLRGKRIAFSRSQIQAQVVLETLQAAGIDRKDVTLVDLPSSIGGDVYTNALASHEVDAAPLASGIVAHHYIAKFGDRGATLLAHPSFQDDGTVLYVPESVLHDAGKAAALPIFLRYWGRAQAWANHHSDELAKGYYQGERGLPPADARLQNASAMPFRVPSHWDDAHVSVQRAIDLLSPVTGNPRFDAASLFDPRFTTIAAEGFVKER